MPTYSYKCKECDRSFESERHGLEGLHCADVLDDSTCFGAIRRIYNFSGSILKGTGWYSVDKRKIDGGTIGIDP